MSIIRKLKARYHAKKAKKFISRANKCGFLSEYANWYCKAVDEYIKLSEIICNPGILAMDPEMFNPGGLFYNEQKNPRDTCGSYYVFRPLFGPIYVTEGMAKIFEENNKEAGE